ncbi:hypothetical protein Y88_2311 [Novosphingobium nitrogenifigens DSM 19370]|uniref:DNA-binding protein n=2 Tax=Novosphingobium nitrogenifigens TaxID=378548 RepID=F1Z690_9SPHN|nr:hypothetical protein Y88_2311 [Novosphingobium nitrogenifigens DSM 19370]
MQPHALNGSNTADALLAQIFKDHGPLLARDALARLMGFSNTKAFDQARRRGALGVKTFKIEGRKGVYALTSDYIAWLERRGQHG